MRKWTRETGAFHTLTEIQTLLSGQHKNIICGTVNIFDNCKDRDAITFILALSLITARFVCFIIGLGS